MKLIIIVFALLLGNICFAADLPKEINIITYSGNAGSTGNKNQMLILLKQSMQRYGVQPKLIYRAGAQGIVAMNMFSESKTDGTFLGIFATADIETNSYPEVRQFKPEDFTKLFDISKHYWVLTSAVNYQPKKDVLFAVNGLTKQDVIEIYSKKMGLNSTIIPYPSTRGETAIMLDVSEQRVDLFFAAINGAIPLYKANKIKLIGVTSTHRLHDLKEIPALSESIPGFEYWGENIIYIHSKVPEETKYQYRKLFEKISQDAQLRDEIISKWNTPILKVY